ncbi:tyrosine-protein phosphatase [Streptomyces sp. NPDC051567]|uniref:tyrosine-protein phosphatase n=1 Tax=Streptomyces sp. NPDC051567 TaxID=3365660 RepID=UPI0037B095AB
MTSTTRTTRTTRTRRATMSRTTRILPGAGLPNVRDTGGLRTSDNALMRRGVLLRGPAPVGDSVGLLTDLGIRTVVDLRSKAETDVADVPRDRGARVLHRPVWGDMTRIRGVRLPGPGAYLVNYRSMLSVAAPVAVEIVQALAAPDTCPLYVCCSVGKDRTGVMTALVLRALGVRLDDIVKDYALTGRAYRKLRPDDPRPPWVDEYSARELAARTASPAWTMRSLLEGIEKEHGHVRAYLTGFGLTGPDWRRARRQALEPARAAAGGA